MALLPPLPYLRQLPSSCGPGVVSGSPNLTSRFGSLRYARKQGEADALRKTQRKAQRDATVAERLARLDNLRRLGAVSRNAPAG
jgi:hypothetical protein